MNQFELVSAELDEKTIATVLVVHRSYSEQLHSFLFTQNVNEVRLPSEFMGKPFEEILTLIEKRKEEMKERFQLSDKQLSELSTTWYGELFALQRVLQTRLDETSVFTKFAQTDSTSLILGWVRKKYLDKTRKTLADTFGGKVIVQELTLTPEEMEEAPTFYDNPRIVKPFEKHAAKRQRPWRPDL